MRKFELRGCNYLPVALDKQLRYSIYHAIYEAQVARTMRLPSFGNSSYKSSLWSYFKYFQLNLIVETMESKPGCNLAFVIPSRSSSLRNSPNMHFGKN